MRSDVAIRGQELVVHAGRRRITRQHSRPKAACAAVEEGAHIASTYCNASLGTTAGQIGYCLSRLPTGPKL